MANGSRPTEVTDLVQLYATASMGVGQALALGTIRSRLAALARSPVLHCLSQIAKRAEKVKYDDLPGKLRLAQALFAPTTARQVVQLIRRNPGVHPVSAQIVVNLALQALDVCTERGNSPSPDQLAHTLGGLILALGDHIEDRRDDDETMALEITRQGLFHSIENMSDWLELSARLFFDVMPGMTDDPDYTDADQVIRRAHGMSLERFWAITTTESIAIRESPEVVFLPMRVEGWDVTDDEERRWTTAWSWSADEAAEAARHDLSLGTHWSFGAFADHPLIWLDNSRERAIAVRPAALPAKATPYGLFWAIRHPLVGGGNDALHFQWSRFFGRAVERLGRSLLTEHLPAELTIYTEDDAEQWGPGKNCDVVLHDHGDVVALDFVYRQFTQGSAGTGDFGSLASDLQRAATEKLEQIDETLAKGLAGGHIEPRRIFPIVVVGGPFPLNHYVVALIRNQVDARSPSVIDKDERCRQPRVLDLASYFLLLRAAKAHDLRVPDILQMWLDSPLGESTFRDWLVTDGPAPPLESSWHDRVYAVVGLPTIASRTAGGGNAPQS